MENIKKGGTIILNRDDKFFKFLSKRAKIKNLKVITFGIHQKSTFFLKRLFKMKNF